MLMMSIVSRGTLMSRVSLEQLIASSCCSCSAFVQITEQFGKGGCYLSLFNTSQSRQVVALHSLYHPCIPRWRLFYFTVHLLHLR